MSKLSVYMLALLAAIVCAEAASTVGVSRDITVVKDVRTFAAKHPGLKMQRLVKVPSPASRSATQSVRYTLGGRVSGDKLVAQGADVYAYPARKDVSVQLTYPEAGTGSIVTFVELVCTQDNADGNAYVVAGGIGQRFISIVVEASQTQNFAYQAQYFGSD